MIFVCHAGARGSGQVGILIDGHALPLAFLHDCASAEAGINAAYECLHPDEFWLAVLGSETIDGPQPNNGLWCYEVQYEVDEEGNPVYEDDQPHDGEMRWDHILGGDFRRLTASEALWLAGKDVLGMDGWVRL
jgi:hypothetical protein